MLCFLGAKKISSWLDGNTAGNITKWKRTEYFHVFTKTEFYFDGSAGFGSIFHDDLESLLRMRFGGCGLDLIKDLLGSLSVFNEEGCIKLADPRRSEDQNCLV